MVTEVLQGQGKEEAEKQFSKPNCGKEKEQLAKRTKLTTDKEMSISQTEETGANGKLIICRWQQKIQKLAIFCLIPVLAQGHLVHRKHIF